MHLTLNGIALLLCLPCLAADVTVTSTGKDHLIKTPAYEATVGNDNTVRLGGIILDIPPAPKNVGFARKRVFVKQHLDGTWSVWYQNQRIATAPATELIEPVRSWKRRNPANKEKSILQTYIASKPAPPSRGHFPFALKGTD